jgi:hypothetical protein
VPGYLLAAGISPDNTPHGYNWTFAFPMLLFIVIGAVLYLVLFQFPHGRVPARRITLPAGGPAAPAGANGNGKAAPGAAASEEAPKPAPEPGE